MFENMNLHLGRIVLSNLLKNENSICQIELCGDSIESHGSVRGRSLHLASALRSHGLKKGQVVLLCGENHNDVIIPVLASLYLGAATLPLSTSMTHNEIKHAVSFGKPDIVFCDKKMITIIENVLKEVNIDIQMVVFDGEETTDKMIPFKELIGKSGLEDDFQVTELDAASTIAFIMCSSGTTGLPKGVCLTHKNIALGILLPAKDSKVLNPLENPIVCFSSLYWFSGVAMAMYSCVAGMPYIHSVQPFSTELMKKAVNKYKASFLFMSPFHAYSLLKCPEIKEMDFTSVKIAVVGGSPISQDALQQLQKLIPYGIATNSYGLTETCGAVCQSGKGKKGSVGMMSEWMKWKVVDPSTEKILGPNEVGELRLKSDTLFKEYYNSPELTSAAFDTDGFFKTGDLVYIDEENFLFIVDRLKEIIKYRNFQVTPNEIENEISKIPGILVCAVVGFPDETDGDLPMAFVQLSEGAYVTVDQIKDAVKGSLSDSKQLRGGVTFLEKMPLTPSDKVHRKKLNIMKLTARRE